MANKKNKFIFDLKPFLKVFLLLLLPFAIYVLYQINKLDENLILFVLLPLMSGIIYENKRLGQNWKSIIYTILISFGVSLLAFLPGKREYDYCFENHLAFWPYFFIFNLIVVSIIKNEEKVTPKLNEAITLLQSIAILYWLINYSLQDGISTILLIGLIIGLIFSIYSFIQAFSFITLSENHRFTLSIWSSIIMLFLAINNLIITAEITVSIPVLELPEKIYIALQFFLLGVASMYIVQNMGMLFGFLPSKYRFFNKAYFKDVKELRASHIRRYSENQAPILYSGICLFYSVLCFFANYYFKIVPCNLAIWIIFVTLPLIINLYEYSRLIIRAKREYRNNSIPQNLE